MDVPAIVQAVVRVLIVLGPPVTGICGLIILRPNAEGAAGRKRIGLARRGLSAGASSVRSVVRAVALPIIGATVLTVSFAIEEEVREGPSRSIDALVDGSEPSSWVLQAGTRHLMNDSRVSASDTEAALADLRSEGIAAVPVRATLASLGTEDQSFSGFVFAIDPGAGLNPKPAGENRCVSSVGEPCDIGSERGVIVDGGNGIDVGDEVSIRGREFEVVAHAAQPRSLINRLVVYVDPSAFDLIEPSETFYAILAAASRERVRAALGASGDEPFEVLSTEQIRAANEDFWAGNGTPLLLLLIGMIAAFAAASTYLSQRAEQEQNRYVLGTLWAIGLNRRQMVEVQLIRSLLAVAVATPVGWIASLVLLELTNRSIIGFSASARVSHLLAASALLCCGALLAAVRLSRHGRHTTPFLA